MTEKEYTAACQAGLIYPKETVQIEALTDKEKRIFLAALRREEKVCKQIDTECTGGENLVRICREIERKVKKALWTN